MTTTRRDFLMGLAAAVMVGAVPITKTSRDGDFDAKREYGNSVSYLNREVAEEDRETFVEYLAQLLAEDARKTLPSGCRFEIREGYARDFGRVTDMCWYYSPDFRHERPWAPGSSQGAPFDSVLGFRLVGRMIA